MCQAISEQILLQGAMHLQRLSSLLRRLPPGQEKGIRLKTARWSLWVRRPSQLNKMARPADQATICRFPSEDAKRCFMKDST